MNLKVSKIFLMTFVLVLTNTGYTMLSAQNLSNNKKMTLKSDELTADPSFVLPKQVSAPSAPVKPMAVNSSNPWRNDDGKLVIPVLDADDYEISSPQKQFQRASEMVAQNQSRLDQINNDLLVMRGIEKNLSDDIDAGDKKLLIPLSPIEKEIVPEVDVDTSPFPPAPQKEYVDYVLQVLEQVKPVEQDEQIDPQLVLDTLPSEMKIHFSPGSSQLSTQSYKWIKALAFLAKDRPQQVLEIRLSNDDLELQSRRFVLLKNLLTSTGIIPYQIRFALTDRNPDSVVIRSIEKAEDLDLSYNQGKKTTQNYEVYRW